MARGSTRLNGRRGTGLVSVPRSLTPTGLAFLKCATASPDFYSTGALGVPDLFSGRSLNRQHTIVASVSCAANSDTYFIFPPVPGVSYWSTTVGIGNPVTTAAWNTTPFADYLGLFSGTSGQGAAFTLNVDQYRFVSNCAELQCTMNQMTWAGTITAWKQPFRLQNYMSVTSTTAGTQEILQTLTGFTSLNISPVSATYSAPVTDGIYSVSMNRQTDFRFDALIPSQGGSTVPTDSGGSVAYPLPGLGGLESIVIRVSVPAGASAQSFNLRSWACVEYTPLTTSFLYEYSKNSAPYDPLALQLYRQIAEQLPIGVPARENGAFWDRILSIIRGVTNLTSFIPGPIGMISRGVRIGAEGINTFTKPSRGTTSSNMLAPD
jgi:hypothetical protein